MKKFLALLVIACFLTSGVVGCGGAATSKKEEPKTDTAKEKGKS